MEHLTLYFGLSLRVFALVEQFLTVQEMYRLLRFILVFHVCTSSHASHHMLIYTRVNKRMLKIWCLGIWNSCLGTVLSSLMWCLGTAVPSLQLANEVSWDSCTKLRCLGTIVPDIILYYLWLYQVIQLTTWCLGSAVLEHRHAKKCIGTTIRVAHFLLPWGQQLLPLANNIMTVDSHNFY